jgi:hypothetical protein
MRAKLFARELAHLLAHYGVSYRDVKGGVVKIGEDSVHLDTLCISDTGYFVKVVEHVEEPFHQISESTIRVIEEGSNPKDSCDLCGSTLKRRWFGLLRSQFCMNPSCDNHDERGFAVLPAAVPVARAFVPTVSQEQYEELRAPTVPAEIT